MNYLFEENSWQNRRSVNMDRVLSAYRRIDGQNVYIAVVCDGVGSLKDGMCAASVSVQMLEDWFENLDGTTRIGLNLRDRVLNINSTVIEMARLYGWKTASTLSALLIAESQYYVVHTGDSRIYSFDAAGLRMLTVDHVVNKRLASYIGKEDSFDVYYGEGSCDGQTFLLCSDGMYKRMDMNFLASELKNAKARTVKKTLDKLARYAAANGESDNISIVIGISKQEKGATI